MLHSELLNYERAFAASITTEELSGTLAGCRSVLAAHAGGAGGLDTMTVSYTHLTLPTILRV